MLPSLGALPLGAPTGAQDDVVTEIMDEKEETLRRRYAAEAPKSPPIYALKQDELAAIAEELTNSKRFYETVLNDDPKEDPCREVEKVCRELATLNRLPGLANDAYDCSDPNSLVWKYAHAIFGVDPRESTLSLLTTTRDQSWKDNFRLLCKAFNMEYYLAMEHDDNNWRSYSVWGSLAECVDVRKYAANENPRLREMAHRPCNEVVRNWEWERGKAGKRFLNKVRSPIHPGSSQIAWRIEHLPRMRDWVERHASYQKSDYDRIKAQLDYIEKEQEPGGRFDPDNSESDEEAGGYYDYVPNQFYHNKQALNKVLRELRALARLFRTLEDQARAMQAAAPE